MSAPAEQSSAVQIPSDAKIITVSPDAGGELSEIEVYAVFDVGGVQIVYKIDTAEGAVNWQDRPSTNILKSAFVQMNVVLGGSAAELATVTTTFGNYKSFWDSILGSVMGYNNPARNDPEVMRVIAEFAARPDMTEAELQNKLQTTSWFQKHTASQLQWNSMSDAEKEKRRQEAASTIIEAWFQFGGERPDINDPRVRNYIEDVASGKMGIGALNSTVMAIARSNSESPIARQERAEQEAQKDRPITIENTALSIRNQLQRWGLQWTNDEIVRWATALVEKNSSDDDLVGAMQQQAAVLYPWKDPQMETLTAAQPWLSTYERVMERKGDLSNSTIQKALTAGQPVWEFEQEMKKSEEWLGTKNGQESMYSVMSDVGRRMGFV